MSKSGQSVNFKCVRVRVLDDSKCSNRTAALSGKSSVINLFPQGGNCGEVADREVDEKGRLLDDKVERWKGVFRRSFGEEFSFESFSDKLKGIDRFSVLQQIVLRRGNVLFKRLNDFHEIKSKIVEFKNNQQILQNVSDFCENWNSRKDCFVYFELKNQALNFYKIRYTYPSICDLSAFTSKHSSTLFKVISLFF